MSHTTEAGSRDTMQHHEGAWTLVVVGPGLMRTHVFAEGDEVVIGRDEDCAVRLDHARISRRHARLQLGKRPAIEDLGSRNGTRVNGEPITKGRMVEVARGEAFGVGPFTFVLIADAPAPAAGPSSLIVDDPAPATPPALLLTVATSPLTILIRGETGVGKELLAETLHRLSGRRGRLVRLNCAAFPAELLESELFGHERGAFTGAVAVKKGLLETATGGTVFLDEVGELPLPLQAKLLRAIEAREIMRVGGTEPIGVDVRFVAATHRDLPSEIARGAFRLDLYYRLAVLTLTIPPLRERLERLPVLATDLVNGIATRAGGTPRSISPAAIARLQKHDWPGNVRELRNVLERAALLAGSGEIKPAHIILDPPVVSGAPPQATAAAAGSAEDDGERQRIVDALQQCAGNQTRAAKLLGISRATLATKLSIHRIPRPLKG